jgi:putative FmdB family regulatory protein
MPIYEYACPDCGHTFEELMRVSDPDPACARCGGAVKKLMSNTSFQLKGSGWYVTDYKGGGEAKKNNGKSPSTDAGSSSESSASTSTGTKADTGSGSAKATATTA